MLLGAVSAYGLTPPPSGQLELDLRKLGRLTSVLYVAAHPDDENTRLIAYLANEDLALTTYVSLTRGDGGQNLLGSDLGERLGLARTQELLAARQIDGGEQRFSRAVDFGFSKTPEETLEIWGREAVLGDLVWVIRSLQPDVIITRFGPEPGTTHGHHTASTWLAQEAFTAAADPQRFPEQLAHVEPWQAKRLLWNTSSFFYAGRDEVNFDHLLSVDTGAYNPLLGASYAEVAALSRSAHKTQGFGATPTLGEAKEYFQHLAGSEAQRDLFEGVDTTWARVAGSGKVAEAIEDAIADFNPKEPWAIVPELLQARAAMAKLPASFWRDRKRMEIDYVIAGCLGLDLESVSQNASAIPGEVAYLTLNAIQRSPHAVEVQFIGPVGETLSETLPLEPNRLQSAKASLVLPKDAAITQPYWLAEAREQQGLFTVSDATLIGQPENGPALPVAAIVKVEGQTLRFALPSTTKHNDPVRGEVKEPFVITPPAMINLAQDIQIFGAPEPRSISARLTLADPNATGIVRFKAGNGWQVEPASIAFEGARRSEIPLTVELIPPAKAGEAILQAEVEVAGRTYTRGFEQLRYEHIPVQTLFPEAKARLVLLDVRKAGERVGFIPGAGDLIPEALVRLGYQVDTLTEADLRPHNLARYDAIVLGIRAVNTVDRIGYYLPALFEYAKQGGVVVMQYNTNRSLQTEDFAPYPLTLSRDRVTDETAEMTVLAPSHPVLNFPNRIGPADFEGWVQERGLYFASNWDDAYTPIFSAHDAGEPPREGSLLIAPVGEGWFAYSGLSWFRQLPAGVPGAYRIFANLVSLGHAHDDAAH